MWSSTLYSPAQNPEHRNSILYTITPPATNSCTNVYWLGRKVLVQFSFEKFIACFVKTDAPMHSPPHPLQQEIRTRVRYCWDKTENFWKRNNCVLFHANVQQEIEIEKESRSGEKLLPLNIFFFPKILDSETPSKIP